MKKIIQIFLIVSILTSCSKNENILDFNQYPQKWQLIKMSGQIPNSETTGTSMEWQEYYLLSSNGSFLKSRNRDNIITEVNGTYSFEDSSDGKFLILTHSLDNILIGNCYSDSKVETLWLKSEDKIIGTWRACDGPGLEYKRIE